nr:MAG TPA: hypothetical protein [Caudoviricetes sp.]
MLFNDIPRSSEILFGIPYLVLLSSFFFQSCDLFSYKFPLQNEIIKSLFTPQYRIIKRKIIRLNPDGVRP